MDKERLLPGTKEHLSRMRAGAAQDRGQGGGHLRQRHDDHYCGDGMSTGDWFNHGEYAAITPHQCKVKI